jgi:hypothetical protein
MHERQSYDPNWMLQLTNMFLTLGAPRKSKLIPDPFFAVSLELVGVTIHHILNSPSIYGEAELHVVIENGLCLAATLLSCTEVREVWFLHSSQRSHQTY